ncbi:HNH endonuclease [Vagococcus carniphilus]|uniref:HNH endonuclease n=1 Tax=Vagococcus carniphilus TaxID=218144 RepID=UPI002891BC4D|nr:HNH endonuclease [Vagococcus carniphilus]MDT2850168.1 HNH endonuclease [Vagococcus carniphilus]
MIESGQYCVDHKPKPKKKKKKEIFHSENKSFYRSEAWQDLRADVYERDGGKCQRCGKLVYGRDAHCHHEIAIKDNPNLKLDKNNIMLLCNKCHQLVENEEEKRKIFPSYFKSKNKN